MTTIIIALGIVAISALLSMLVCAFFEAIGLL
jgi:hypothetical protein